MRDLSVAVERSRRLLDADADPVSIDSALGADPALAPMVSRLPGLRVPGQVDGFEVAVRAIVGQQVTVAGARRIASGLAATYGDSWPDCPVEGLHTVFPEPAALAGLRAGDVPMPGARVAALATLACALDSGTVALDRSQERGRVRSSLLALRGIGPWTADYVALRALGDPDVFLPGDAGVKAALRRMGDRHPGEDGSRWSPWRSYAVMHLWTWPAEAGGRPTDEGEG
jgi:AraC family transcriptional regulator of adaptative response / DNA-3-methyladenine glycosylase II